MQAADLASPGTCQRLVDVTTRGEEDEEGEGIVWGGGGGGWAQGLVNGYTMCRETRSSTLQQTALSSQRERQSGRAREREAEREGGFIFLPFCLSVISGEHTDTRGPKAHGLIDTHAWST